MRGTAKALLLDVSYPMVVLLLPMLHLKMLPRPLYGMPYLTAG